METAPQVGVRISRVLSGLHTLKMSDVTAGTHASAGDTTQAVIPRRNAVLQFIDDGEDRQ